VISDPGAIRQAFERLKSLLDEVGNIDDDDAIALRLADVEIELIGVEETAKRTPFQSVRWHVVTLKCTELGERIAALVIDMLAWQALPATSPGDNEPPIVSRAATELRSDFMGRLAADGTAMMRLRDELAVYLAEHLDAA